jgi:putative ABC transport system permease protein
MTWVAFKMLTGNPGKYLSIILGIAFSSLLITQQASIFCGLMRLTASQIRDVRGADIWVMDPNVQFIDDLKPMSDNELYRVRGVSGVRWAVRFYKGLTRGRLDDGNYQQMILLGLDDATLVGAPQEIIAGNLSDLRKPDAVFMDERGVQQLWPDDPYRLGRVFEMNDHRAVLVGVCKASQTFQTFPVVYTRYSQAIQFIPRERKVLTFVLAQNEPDVSAEEVCKRIEQQTGLQALTRNEFINVTINYYMTHTGIPINFLTTIILGFVVGVAVAGQTFYLFTVENLRQFGTLKAIGVSNGRILLMILFQATVVGVVGYGIGVGIAGGFGEFSKNVSRLAFFMPWQVPAIAGVAVILIVLLSSISSIWRVLILEPAVVFKGE